MKKLSARILFLLGILITSCCLLMACSGESDSKPLNYLTISDHDDMGTLFGDQINYNQLQSIVIKNTDNWTSFWNQYTEGKTPKPEKPTVDFNQHMVVGIFMEVGTPCTGFEVIKVSEGSSIQIDYQVKPSDAVCVQVTADKAEIIIIEKTDKTINFNRVPAN